MKVTKKYPIFQESDSLIIVTGKQQALFYEVHQGRLERVDAFKVPRARWSDNEGHFKMRAGGRALSSGSVREEDKNNGVIRKFLLEFRHRIKGFSADRFSELYILAPKEVRQRLLETLPVTWQKKLAGLVEGNFSYAHPSFVLERIVKSVSA